MQLVIWIFRTAFQLFGGAIMALGGVALIFEAIVLLAGDGRMNQALGQVWFQHDPFVNSLGTASLPLFGAIVERKIHPALWNPIITTWLSWPSWLALLFAALLFGVVGGGIIWLANSRQHAHR